MTDINSISTAAVASSSISTTELPSKTTTPSSTGVTQPRTGSSSTPTSPPTACPLSSRRMSLVANSPSGLRPLTPPAWTPSSGHEPAPQPRFGGRGEWMRRRARTGRSLMRGRDCRSSERGCWREECEEHRLHSCGAVRLMFTIVREATIN